MMRCTLHGKRSWCKTIKAWVQLFAKLHAPNWVRACRYYARQPPLDPNTNWRSTKAASKAADHVSAEPTKTHFGKPEGVPKIPVSWGPCKKKRTINPHVKLLPEVFWLHDSSRDTLQLFKLSLDPNSFTCGISKDLTKTIFKLLTGVKASARVPSPFYTAWRWFTPLERHGSWGVQHLQIFNCCSWWSWWLSIQHLKHKVLGKTW